MVKNKFKRQIKDSFLSIFLFWFVTLIFGPAELFFANTGDFDFKWVDFGPYGIAIAVAVTFILVWVMTFLQIRIRNIITAVFFGLSLAMYCQGLLLNGKMSLMGTISSGLVVPPMRGSISFIVWVLIIAISIELTISSKTADLSIKVFNYCAGFLFAIQFVALISLLVGASVKSIYKYPDTKSFLDGKEQMYVSSDENIIVIILDMFSDNDWEALNAAYPEAQDIVHDFTYYTDCNATYAATFPSVAHMVTGQEMQPDITVKDWMKNIWDSDEVKYIYGGLKDRNFKVNMYESSNSYLYGPNDISELNKYIDNAVKKEVKYRINNAYAIATVVNSALYKYVPWILKPLFYDDNMSDKVVSIEGIEKAQHNNGDFLEKLKQNGITVDGGNKYFIVQHLRGMHNYTTDKYGNECEESSRPMAREDNAMGCMVLVDEYLNELRAKGVYDKSTIIITADHCHVSEYDDVIFMVKTKNESHDVLQLDDSPISHCQLLPTIAYYAGINVEDKYDTIYDCKGIKAEDVTRSLIIADYSSDYPEVKKAGNNSNSSMNVYNVFTYKGGRDVLNSMNEDNISDVLPMIDNLY